MKILLVNKFFYLKGGAEASFFETAKLLKSKGHEVIFFAMEHPDNFSSCYAKYFVSKVDFNEAGSMLTKLKAAGRVLYSFEAKRKVRNLIEDERPDIVYLNNIHHQVSPSILHTFKKWNLPVVMSLRDYKMVCPTYSMLARGRICEKCKGEKYYWCLINRCTKNSYLKSASNVLEMYLHHRVLHIYNLVDLFIAPSLFLKEKTREMGFKGEVIHLPNFVKLDGFEASYDYNERSIVYFGRLSQEKGLFTLFKAIKGRNIELKIVGDGPLRQKLEYRIKEDRLDNVFFTGYKQDKELKEEITKSMLVVLPSEWYENNPRTVIEAFALGKPVIGAKIGGIPELVQDGKTGLTFEPGNAADLRDKIKYLINSPEKISEMGRNARKFVEKEMNPEKHYQQLMKIYQLAMEKHK